MEIRKRPEQPPKQHRAAFCGEAAQSRPDQLETSWDIASINPELHWKPFERRRSCNHVFKPVLTQCSHSKYCMHLRRSSGHPWALRNWEGLWWVWQQWECGGSSMGLRFSHTRGKPLLPCKTQEVDSGEGRFPSGLPKTLWRKVEFKVSEQHGVGSF